MKHIRWIWRFWQPHRAWLWVLLILTLLSSGVTLAFPLVFRYVVDSILGAISEVRPEVASDLTWKAIWIIAGIGLARSIAYIYPGFRAMLNAKLGMDVREYYFSTILGKGHRFFQKFRTGDLVTRLTDDIEQFPKISWFSCSGIFRAVESGSKFLFCVGFMLFMNWKLALVSISPLPVMLTIFYFIRLSLTKRSLERQEIISRTNDALESAFSGIRIVKAFRAEDNQTNEFHKLLNERIDVEIRFTKLWMGVHNVYMWIQYAGQAIVMVVGGTMVINGTLSIGELYAFYIYLSLLAHPVLDIPQLFVSSRQAFACIDREIEIEETHGGMQYYGSLEVGNLKTIQLRNVSFRYDEHLPYALKDINMTIKRGEKAAVVGSVGSGKSTLIKVMAGLLPPTSGDVLVNGHHLNEYNVDDYRLRIGYIPQESTLFSESVFDNTAFGREINEEKVLDSLGMAQVKQEIEEMPKGIHQVLGQRGLTVSGGQKQRLAIARALAGVPELLLMDDCTSALDAENERRFWQMFSERFPETACLIVTHRLATAMQADMIYVLDEGRMVGQGSHEELLNTCEEYRNFLTREELQAALRGSKSA